MKAVNCFRYGNHDALKIIDTKIPIPGDNDILVKVHASTVNRTDCAMLKAKPVFMRLVTGLFKPKKKITGTDFAGIVEKTGKNVSNFKLGDKVFGFEDMGIKSHAEFLIISDTNAIQLMPENTSFEEATSSAEGVHYAYNFLNKVNIIPGQKVLINGGTGAIGNATIQLAKYHDLEVTTTCRTEHIDALKALGVNTVIDYTKEDFTKNNEKYDYVFDTVGKSTFGKCKPILKGNGIYISSELGPGSQNVFYALFTPWFSKKKVRFPYPPNRLRSLKFIKKLIEEGKFKPLIDKTYALDEACEAFKYVITGQKVGNVVLKIQRNAEQSLI